MMRGWIALGIVLCAAPTALAQEETPPTPEEQRPQQQQAEQAMQGGGMTDERALADATARGHFRLGTEAYDRGEFQQAAQEFEEAYRLSQRPQLMFNAYVAYRDANDLEGAVRSLRVYLEESGDDVQDRVNLEARLRSMSEALDQQRAREAELAAQREAPVAPPPPPPGPEAWPWAILGVGAAALVAGAITGGIALGEADSFASQCPDGVCGPEVDFEGRNATLDALGIATDVLLFGGAAIAVTGLILGIVLSSGGEQAEPAEQEVEVSAGCGPSGCAASLRARF